MPKALEGENDDAVQSNLRAASLFDVTGKVIVISGGGSGIGAMLASGYCQNGAKVYIFSRKDTSPFAAELTAKGPGTCHALTADLADPAALQSVVDAVDAAEGKVDVLVNNAGTNFNGALADTPRDAFSKVLDINITAIFQTIQLFHPLLLKAAVDGNPSRVLNISSINGMEPPVKFDTFAYSTSKAGVIMMSRHLAARLAPDVLVNAICPGPFRSRMMRGTLEMAGEEFVADGTLCGRIGAPGDIVGVALWLSSEAGGFVTGMAVPIDGGALLAGL